MTGVYNVTYNPILPITYDPMYEAVGGINPVGTNDGAKFQDDVLAMFQNGNIATFQGYEHLSPFEDYLSTSSGDRLLTSNSDYLIVTIAP